MKCVKKINIIIIILIVTSLLFSNYSQASEIGNIFSSADEFLTKGNTISSTISEPQLQETSNFMYKLLMAIGIVVMFIVGTIIGIQYMVASAEDKAKVKEALVPYIVGCFVIFGAFSIWSIAVNLGQDITTSTQNMYYIEYGNWDMCFTCNGNIETLCRLRGHRLGTKTERYFCINCNTEITVNEANRQTCDSCGFSL